MHLRRQAQSTIHYSESEYNRRRTPRAARCQHSKHEPMSFSLAVADVGVALLDSTAVLGYAEPRIVVANRSVFRERALR